MSITLYRCHTTGHIQLCNQCTNYKPSNSTTNLPRARLVYYTRPHPCARVARTTEQVYSCARVLHGNFQTRRGTSQAYNWIEYGHGSTRFNCIGAILCNCNKRKYCTLHGTQRIAKECQSILRCRAWYATILLRIQFALVQDASDWCCT